MIYYVQSHPNTSQTFFCASNPDEDENFMYSFHLYLSKFIHCLQLTFLIINFLNY